MKQFKDYIMNIETAALIPHYNEFGRLVTIVFERDRYFIVEMSPYALIDYNLRYYGSSMRGAKDGAKDVIGNISMPPVAINEALEIYWLPSKSPTEDDCVWFGLHFIVSCDCDGQGGANVSLTNGYVVQVDLCYKKMNKRINQTHILKSKTEKRTKQMLEKSKMTMQMFIKKLPEQLNFEIEFDDQFE